MINFVYYFISYNPTINNISQLNRIFTTAHTSAMASNSTTPNEGVSGDEDNNSQEINKNAATWKLLTNYIDRFVKEEDYKEYTNIMSVMNQF